MTLQEQTEKLYKKEIEENYAGFIKDKLLVLLTSEDQLPRSISLAKNKRFDSPTITGDPTSIRYHELIMPSEETGGEYKVTIVPELQKIEISHTFTRNSDTHKVFLSFSIQKELFDDYTPIEKAPIDKAYLVDDFVQTLRKIKLP